MSAIIPTAAQLVKVTSQLTLGPVSEGGSSVGSTTEFCSLGIEERMSLAPLW